MIQVELLYAYFIQQQLNRVAQKCLISATKAESSGVREDLQASYRRLVGGCVYDVIYDVIDEYHCSYAVHASDVMSTKSLDYALLLLLWL